MGGFSIKIAPPQNRANRLIKLGLIFVRRVVLSLVHQSAFKTRRLALTPPSKPPPVVPTLPAPGTRQTRQMPSASLILLAKARRWFSDATLAGACRPRSGAPVASAAQRRCWLVGPAPVGAGEASARSPTAVRSPLRSAPLHSWPSAPGINRHPLPNRSACRVPPTPGQGLYVATPRRGSTVVRLSLKDVAVMAAGGGWWRYRVLPGAVGSGRLPGAWWRPVGSW